MHPGSLSRSVGHFCLCLAFLLLSATASLGDSGTWLANPMDNNWNNPANWSSGTVPGPFDTASFAGSTVTNIVISSGGLVEEFIFQEAAAAYTITALPGVNFSLRIGVENESPVQENFFMAADGNASGGFTFEDGGFIAGPVTFTQEGANVAGGSVGYVAFQGVFSLTGPGNATFHNLASSVSGGAGGQTNFYYNASSAEDATIINDGATVSGATGGAIYFIQNEPSAGNATFIANGGSNGGGGGSIHFDYHSRGDTVRLELFGNGYMDMSTHGGPSLSVGSIEGDGQIYLGKATLIVGTNSLSTTFSGVLHPGGPAGDSGSGTLSKTGIGTLSLTGANLYTNGTTVTQGSLIVSNKTGSGTGTGPVNVNAGTLGGSGIIAGAVTIGTGSGTGAFLTPGIGTNKQVTLTIQSALTFNSNATYTYTFKGSKSRVQTDLVLANGVTITGGAIAISSSSQNRLRRGTVLTVISNTSANPISGTFSNLPEGAIVTVKGNNLQASYEGGDGNDLTLTVVP